METSREISRNFPRGVNSRELFWFLGHSSLSHHAILTKIGAKSSYRPPPASYTLQEPHISQKTLVSEKVKI